MTQLQFIDKVADIPIVTQRQIPMLYNVQKAVEVPQYSTLTERWTYQ